MEIRRTGNLEFYSDSTIVYIIGMPGSGKSTFASRYLADFSVIDIDDIFGETEEMLNFKKLPRIQQMLISDKFFDILMSRLHVAIKRSLRKKAITFVIANLTYKPIREEFVQKFLKFSKHCYAIVLDIDKQTVIRQYKNDKYNEGMEEYLANFDDFQSQIKSNSFEEFDTVYILDKHTVNSVTITTI